VIIMRSASPLAIAFLLGSAAACAPEGSSAYVSRNLPLDGDCTPMFDGNAGIATGSYDVGDDRATGCVHSYMMSLLVNSSLKANARDSTGRAEPNVLLITHADVRIMNKNEETLNFLLPNKSADPLYPNPYRVHTAASLEPTVSASEASTGYVQIEAIPKAYASKLTGYNGNSILLEVQVFGTTTGDVDVDFRPFLYPLVICTGCMSSCYGDIKSDTVTTTTGDGCQDNGAQDGRRCIDPGC
jgi:hypothetical protein